MFQRRQFIKLGLGCTAAMACMDPAWALQYYPMPSDRKWAVLYGTWCGSTRDAALWISEGMGGIADVFDVRENPDLNKFNHIIIGGAIRRNLTRDDLQEYIKTNRHRINTKIRGLFAVCGNMRKPPGPAQTALFIDNHLAPLCGSGDVPSRVFPGRITRSLMDPQTAAIMAGIEDYDDLKRADCMAFGTEILRAVIDRGSASENRPPGK